MFYQILGMTILIFGLIGNIVGFFMVNIPQVTQKYDQITHIKLQLSKKNYYLSKKLSIIDFITKTPEAKQISHKHCKIIVNEERTGVSRFLLKFFYSINAINVLTLITSPLMEVYSMMELAWMSRPINNTHNLSQHWLFSYHWNSYLAYFHKPITKPLIVISFLIYVLLFITQGIAIIKPLHYQNIVTKCRANIFIILAFVYSFAWYLPTFMWKQTRKINICPIVNFTEYDREYTYQPTKANYIFNTTLKYPIHLVFMYTIYSPAHNTLTRYIWITYQISRELFTKCIPFLAIMAIKGRLILKKQPKPFCNDSLRGLTYSLENGTNNPLDISPQIFPMLSKSKSDILTNAAIKKNICEPLKNHPLESDTDSIQKSLNHSSISKNDPVFSHSVLKRMKEIKVEHEMHIRTVFILTLEFLFLMLPVTLMQMSMDFFIIRYNELSLSLIYAVLNTLEFIYVSMTFYINFLFNRLFRRSVLQQLDEFKKWVTKKAPNPQNIPEE
ncbi:unnamed protein product [Gordionus sp. m RMFG-2023]